MAALMNFWLAVVPNVKERVWLERLPRDDADAPEIKNVMVNTSVRKDCPNSSKVVQTPQSFEITTFLRLIIKSSFRIKSFFSEIPLAQNFGWIRKSLWAPYRLPGSKSPNDFIGQNFGGQKCRKYGFELVPKTFSVEILSWYTFPVVEV